MRSASAREFYLFVDVSSSKDSSEFTQLHAIAELHTLRKHGYTGWTAGMALLSVGIVPFLTTIIAF